jgi:hypothetical protein
MDPLESSISGMTSPSPQGSGSGIGGLDGLDHLGLRGGRTEVDLFARGVSLELVGLPSLGRVT